MFTKLAVRSTCKHAIICLPYCEWLPLATNVNSKRQLHPPSNTYPEYAMWLVLNFALLDFRHVCSTNNYETISFLEINFPFGLPLEPALPVDGFQASSTQFYWKSSFRINIKLPILKLFKTLLEPNSRARRACHFLLWYMVCMSKIAPCGPKCLQMQKYAFFQYAEPRASRKKMSR